MAEWVYVASEHQNSGLIAKDPDRPGPMTSSVSCVGHHNEVWFGGAPGKMTETFQDVSTSALRC